MLQYKIYKWLTHDHTDLGWLTGILMIMAAGTFICSYIGRPLEYDIARYLIRDNLFQIMQRNIFIIGYDGMGLFRCKDFAVIVL
ncbi:MAG: hypothetical protein K8R17_01785 [Methanosarcinales archaeon]|nr:hypothetical protein [Methanosarcinales archaeon]